MRISVSHKFVFVHIPKTAGTTIKKIIVPYCEERPINTPWRRLITNLPVREDYGKALVRSHYTARWARLKFGRAFYDELFSFSFVRNPFDLIVSRYEFIKNAHWHHRHKTVGQMNFSQFLEWEASRHRFMHRDQTSFVCDLSGNVIVDEIYRFENLSEDVPRMAERIGIPVPEQLIWEKKQKRRPYMDYYLPEDIDRVAKIFRRDLQQFHYDFK